MGLKGSLFFGAIGLLLLAVIMFGPFIGEAPEDATPDTLEIATSFPTLDGPKCQAKVTHVYDECGDQVEMFEQAKAAAAEQDKVLLVIYGAEWCLWCHVMHSFLKGGDGNLSYRYGEGSENPNLPTGVVASDLSIAEARRLAAFVARNFVTVSIDARVKSANDPVLKASGAYGPYPGSIPYVFSVGADGQYADSFTSAEWGYESYRSEWPDIYDRADLMRGLKRLWHKARG